jgi:hypothetical protein
VRAAVVSRVIVWAAGVTTLAVFGRARLAVQMFDHYRLTEPFHDGLANLLVAPAARWDSVWYLAIAHYGYFSRPASAYFPLYPLLIRAATPLFGSALLAGAAISLAAMPAALYLLHRLARLDLSERAAALTVLLVALFPTALFLSAVYTEALYLLLSVGAIYAARLDRWRYAGLLGAGAALTRPNGVLVVLPLVIIYLYGPRRDEAAVLTRAGRWRPRYRVDRSGGWIALVPLGALVYLAYLGVIWHAPLAEYQAEAAFGRQFGGPLSGVLSALAMLPSDIAHLVSSTAEKSFFWDPLTWTQQRVLDLGFFAFTVGGLLAGRRRLPVAYVVYALALVVPAASYPHGAEPLASLPRYLLVAYPAFMGWGAALAGRGELTRMALAASAAMLAAFGALWGIWAWIA